MPGPRRISEVGKQETEPVMDRRRAVWTSLSGLLAIAAVASADPSIPALAPYAALHPGLTVTGAVSYEPGTGAFDRDGHRHSDAFPAIGGGNETPAVRGDLNFAWTFPLFQDEGVPFLSTRLHTFRLTLRGDPLLDATGPVADFASANGHVPAEDGIGDLTFEIGSFLWGSESWEARGGTPPRTILALMAIDLPVGIYDTDAAVNSGSNTFAFRPTLGAHTQILPTVFADTGLAYEWRKTNEDPAFGGLDPSEPGNRLFADAALSWRAWPSLYVSGLLRYRNGRPNGYVDPMFAPNAPTPPAGFENRPALSHYEDDGSWLLSVGPRADWFVGQNVRLGASALFPLAGEGGQFVLPFENRLQGCEQLAGGCTPSDGGSVLVDGLGQARALASPTIRLDLTWAFGQGGSWP